jgi:dTDP-4-amino-4,6-dideoxygalactose transaminase
MGRAGANMHFIDAAEDGFLMDEKALARSQNRRHAIVLGELYGHTYDLATAGRAGSIAPLIRIVDMAMTVPQPALFQRLSRDDFAVISFGVGKSMYAGWGAMGFAGNKALADEVRRLREATLVRDGIGLRMRRAAKIFLRTAGHYSPIYSMAKRLRPQNRPQGPPTERVEEIPPGWSQNETMGREWKEGATSLDCRLSAWNLERAAYFQEVRTKLARRYRENLEGVEDLICPRTSPAALSHFTIRVDPAHRDRLRQLLFQAGLNTITMWDFPRFLDRAQFPNAFRRSREILNLPLIPGMSIRRLDGICDDLKRCLTQVREQSR